MTHTAKPAPQPEPQQASPSHLTGYEDLAPDPHNANKGTELGRALLEESFRNCGAGRSVVATADGGIPVGNKSLEVASDLGMPVRFVHTDGTELVVVVRDDIPSLDDPRARELATADNAVAAKSLDWDPLELKYATEIAPGAAKYFSDDELAALLKEIQNKPPPGAAGDEFDEDAAYAEIKDPVTKPGDLWAMGSHRLFCFDSCHPAAADYLRLWAGDRLSCVWTDPPYAIYGSSTGVSSDIADDSMVRPFFETILRQARRVLPWFGHAYFACDWRSWASIWESAKRSGLAAKNLIVWDKCNPGMGSSYSNSYELIGFFSKLPPQTTMGDRPAGQRTILKSNLMRHNRVSGRDRLHNAAKPVDLVGDCVINSTEPGDVVVDFFGGSGTTLIACHRQNRVAMLVEKEPKWCDVILSRWETEGTGLRPQLLGNFAPANGAADSNIDEEL